MDNIIETKKNIIGITNSGCIDQGFDHNGDIKAIITKNRIT